MSNNLADALAALYDNTEPALREQASRWLEEWQQSPEAWSMAHEVLQQENAGLEAHYICAQTLRTKVQRDFEELPPNAAISLRDTLVDLLLRYAKGQAPVRTQLCLAIAALATHLPSQQWGEGGVVGWLTKRLSPEAPDSSLPCMLELLTVLPQEAGGYQPSLRPERRRQVKEEMEAALSQALSVLGDCLARIDARGREQALEAFAAWLKLSGGAGVTGPTLLQTPLTSAALEGLRSSDSFYAAADAVVEMIYCSSHSGRPRDDMAPLVQALVPQIMALRPRFHICAAQALAEREDRFEPHPDIENHEEDAKAIARLFAEVGEAYTDLIAGGAPEVMPPVEALLDVASHLDDSICAISFNFWHRLSRALTVGLHPQPLFSEEPAVPKEEADRRVSVFIPTFQRLVTLIRGRVKFPNDFSTWNRDERADFKRARVAVGDTLMDAAAVLGGAETLRLLVEPLMELSARVAAGGAFDWQAAEAALYCVRCIHRAAPPPGDGLLLQLFCALPSLPAPPSLQYTAALTVGAYADWLSETARAAPEGIQLLNSLLDMLVKGLANSESCGACALSLRRVCDGCALLLASSTPTLLDLYRRVQSSGDIGGTSGSDELGLDEEDVAHVVEAVTLVASALPDGERQACVQRMLDVVVQPMQAILQPWMGINKSSTALGSPDPSQLPLVLPLAERITTIFRSVRDPGDVGEALVRLWPWLEAALNAFGSDAGAAEKICRVPRYAVRNAGKAASGAVPVLSAALPQRFEATAHSCYLYVASELIKTFGDDFSADNSLEPMLVRLLTAACSALNSLQAVSSRPDVADDTFLLAGRALNYAPRLIITPKILPTLLASVQSGLLVQHRDACSSIAAFVVRLLDPATLRKCPSEASNHLQAALGPFAANFIRLAMAGSVGALPPSRLQEMTDIIYALLKVASVQGLEWTSQAVAAIPDGVLAPSDRQRFIQVCQTIVSDGIAVDDEQELMHALADLSDCCRRNRKTEAVAQRALLPQELQYIVR
ncbi:hypothetical protein Ndes2526B_g02895 [Nannochloris sp. 'desiccata']